MGLPIVGAMPRLVCFDLETTGWKPEGYVPIHQWPMPCHNWPLQLSVDVVDDELKVSHAFDTLIQGAISTCEMTQKSVLPQLGLTVGRLQQELLERGRPLSAVLQQLAELLTPGSVLVAHNLSYDLGKALLWNYYKPRVAGQFAGATEALHKILAAPRLCTLLWQGRPFKKHEYFAAKYDVAL